jgi:branched-subunit amino acid transport protein
MVVGGAADKTMERCLPLMFLASMQLGGPLKHLLMLAVPLILLASLIALWLRQSIRRHSERLGKTIARDRF